jgi:hypothetical protein
MQASFTAPAPVLVAPRVQSNPWTYTAPLLVAGFGLGCTMVPLMAVAMREVAPAMSGAASGFMSTVRQVGAAIGTAVVGAVLANQVAADLPRQAARLVSQLPPQARAHFLAYWQAASHSVQQFGAGQTVSFQPAPGMPPAVARHIAAVYQQTFAQAFLNGRHPALIVIVVALCAGAVIVTGLRGGRTAEEALQTHERVSLAAVS